MELGGTARGNQYDAVSATDALVLDGTMQVELLNGFTPVAGDRFDLFDWGTLAGTFNTLNLPPLPASEGWDTSGLYATGTLAVTGVPEPGSLALMGVAAIGWVTFWRRRWQSNGPSASLSA
jgi:hypothetical protein